MMAIESGNEERCRYECGEAIYTEQRFKRHTGLWLPFGVPVWIDRLSPYYSDPPVGMETVRNLVGSHARIRASSLPVLFHAQMEKNDFVWFYRSSKAPTLLSYTKDRRLTMSEIRAIVTDLTAGVSGLHAAGLVHGGLTVDKILMVGRGRIVLTDTGLARQCNSILEQGQAQEAHTLPSLPAPQTDIAGWGSVLGYLLTGQIHFGRVLVAGLPTDNYDVKLARKTLMECEVPLRLVEVVYRSMSAANGSGNPYATLEEAWASFAAATTGQ